MRPWMDPRDLHQIVDHPHRAGAILALAGAHDERMQQALVGERGGGGDQLGPKRAVASYVLSVQ